jgi:hypothetical protein
MDHETIRDVFTMCAIVLSILSLSNSSKSLAQSRRALERTTKAGFAKLKNELLEICVLIEEHATAITTEADYLRKRHIRLSTRKPTLGMDETYRRTGEELTNLLQVSEFTLTFSVELKEMIRLWSETPENEQKLIEQVGLAREKLGFISGKAWQAHLQGCSSILDELAQRAR